MKQLRLLQPYMAQAVGSSFVAGNGEAEILIARGIAEDITSTPHKAVESFHNATQAVSEVLGATGSKKHKGRK